MKVSPESFILNNYEPKDGVKKILISGNEETLISKITEKIIALQKNNSTPEIIIKTDTVVDKDGLENSFNTLFSNLKIAVFKQPKTINLKALEEEYPDLFIIIEDSRIKNNSAVKNWFEKSKCAYSVSCYKLSDTLKKTILTQHISKNNIGLSQEAYWFFLENTDDRYGLFDAELTKLTLYGGTNISKDEVISLLAKNQSDEVERLFFLLLGPSNKIITETNRLVSSTGAAYTFLYQVKMFLNIFLLCQNIEDINQRFPRHMFMYKKKFIEIYKKINKKNMVAALGLIKKTEMVIRKNETLYLSTIQRFLLNIKRILR